jgi:hypothetical protein
MRRFAVERLAFSGCTSRPAFHVLGVEGLGGLLVRVPRIQQGEQAEGSPGDVVLPADVATVALPVSGEVRIVNLEPALANRAYHQLWGWYRG